MRRSFPMFLIALAPAMLAMTGAASADGFTARIVTQPYYGAVTTLEHGVRVIRPLPPERYVIVNPNRTPLALSFNENNVYDYSSNATSSGGDLGVVDPDGPIYTRPSYGPGYWKHRNGGWYFRNGHNGHFAGGPRGKGSPGAIGAH
ncbi:MAG: hypothetical protein J0H37_09385 [Hyphomicrobium denitrificans]|nr:hypothetical protein [Hyphomicrobium denitrificans]